MSREYNPDRKSSGFGLGIIRCLPLGCGVLIILLFIVIPFVLIAKPKAIWPGVVDFLNNGYETKGELPINALDAEESIKSQVRKQGFGEAKVVVKDVEATVLARESFPELKNVQVFSKDGYLEIIWEYENSIEDNPLLGYAEIYTKSNKLEIRRLGTPKFRLPNSLSQRIFGAALVAFKFQDGETSDNIILDILNNTIDYEVTDVEFQQGQMTIYLIVDV